MLVVLLISVVYVTVLAKKGAHAAWLVRHGTVHACVAAACCTSLPLLLSAHTECMYTYMYLTCQLVAVFVSGQQGACSKCGGAHILCGAVGLTQRPTALSPLRFAVQRFALSHPRTRCAVL